MIAAQDTAFLPGEPPVERLLFEFMCIPQKYLHETWRAVLPFPISGTPPPIPDREASNVQILAVLRHFLAQSKPGEPQGLSWDTIFRFEGRAALRTGKLLFDLLRIDSDTYPEFSLKKWYFALLPTSTISLLSWRLGAVAIGNHLRKVVESEKVARLKNILGAELYRFSMTYGRSLESLASQSSPEKWRYDQFKELDPEKTGTQMLLALFTDADPSLRARLFLKLDFRFSDPFSPLLPAPCEDDRALVRLVESLLSQMQQHHS